MTVFFQFPMDEVIDDLISLESGFNDGGLDCMDPSIIMQNNVSMTNHINYYISCKRQGKNTYLNCKTKGQNRRNAIDMQVFLSIDSC